MGGAQGIKKPYHGIKYVQNEILGLQHNVQSLTNRMNLAVDIISEMKDNQNENTQFGKQLGEKKS